MCERSRWHGFLCVLCAWYCFNQLAWIHEILHGHSPRAVLSLEQGLMILCCIDLVRIARGKLGIPQKLLYVCKKYGRDIVDKTHCGKAGWSLMCSSREWIRSRPTPFPHQVFSCLCYSMTPQLHPCFGQTAASILLNSHRQCHCHSFTLHLLSPWTNSRSSTASALGCLTAYLFKIFALLR